MVNSKDIIFALSNILDMADSRLARHQQRVAYIVWKMAEESGMNKQDMEDLLLATLLHDVGALSIKEKISLVRGKEKYLVKHTIVGYDLLKEISWMQKSAIYVKYHHRKWSEFNLKEHNDLSLPCQILYLADMVEVLIDRDQFILNQVNYIKSKITNLSGKNFSPNVVKLFLSVCKYECFWFDLTSEKLPYFLKESIPFEGIKLSLDDMLSVSELIRRIIDFESPYTATHSAGVAEAAAVISKLLNFDDDTIIKMRIAGNLHDIGKLSIPEFILEKQGRLTDQEYDVIKKHAYETYRALNEIKGLEDITNWAAQHHERINGNGYPFGLSKDELCIESRAMAIADFFTSIIEDRPYRSGMEKKRAVALLDNQAKVGLLDEEIIGILIANYDHCSHIIKTRQYKVGQKYKSNIENIHSYKSNKDRA